MGEDDAGVGVELGKGKERALLFVGFGWGRPRERLPVMHVLV